MWKSTLVKSYCLTCGKKLDDNAEDAFASGIKDHLKENPDHICIKGTIYKKCELDDEKEDIFHST